MAGRSSWMVTALTAAAVATVGFFAYQASATAPDHPVRVRGSASAGPHPSASAGHGDGKAHRKPAPPKVPAHSGTGKRVVYALGAQRVWLVGADGRAERTFTVTPSTVNPAPGSYTVTSRSAQGAGSDGVAIEHTVRFTAVNGVVVGFSAAVDGSTQSPDPSKQTGGIRESRADGTALWDFTAAGDARIVVVA